MPIEWDESLRTGIQSIDEQHQELIVMLHRLGRFRCSRDDFNDAFDELEDYANIHFKIEENYMISLNYPKYKEHKAFHNTLIDTIEKFKQEIIITKDTYELGGRIIEIVWDWMKKHYSTTDIELAKFIKQVSG